jgi:transposase
MKRTELKLSEAECKHLKRIIRSGVASARKLGHARILLQADEGKAHDAIAESVEVSYTTVTRVCQRYLQEGLEAALQPAKAVRNKPRKLDGRGEAKLITLACSEPPEGRARWTLSLLADKLVELKVVESIVPETIRQTLKKMNLPPT